MDDIKKTNYYYQVWPPKSLMFIKFFFGHDFFNYE